MAFNHNIEQEGFIGNLTLTQVLEQDAKELAEIDGSFEAIADRMQEIREFAITHNFSHLGPLNEEEYKRQITPLCEKWKAEGKNKLLQQFIYETALKIAEHPKTWYDNEVAVIQYYLSRFIFQKCPFDECKEKFELETVRVISRKNKKMMMISKETIHLAHVHHFLGKGNDYGISAKEFYESFMPTPII